MRGELYVIDPDAAVAAIKRTMEIIGLEPIKQMSETDPQTDRIAAFQRGASARRMSMVSAFKTVGEL